MNKSTKNMIAALILAVGVVGVSFYSCEKEEITPNEYTPQTVQEMEADASNTERSDTDVRPNAEERITPEDFLNENYVFTEPESLCGKPFKKAIINPDGKEIGTAYVFNTDKNFYVWMVVNEGYKMKSAAMHFASNPKQFPIDRRQGVLDYSKFKFSTPDSKEIGRMMDFSVAVDQLDGSSFVAATAEYQGPDGNWRRAWIGKEILDGVVQARIFKYNEQKCTVDPTHPGTPDNDNPDA